MPVVRLLAAGLLALGMVVTLATASSGERRDPPPGQEACKPGWGYGDTNHEHCGPPGQRP